MSSEHDEHKMRKQLSLSKDTIKQGKALEKALNRPSFSNVVEALIGEEHKRQFPNSEEKAAA